MIPRPVKPRVLIAIHSDTYRNELLRVATMLGNSSQYEPIIFFPHFYSNLQRDIDEVLEKGFLCLTSNGRAASRGIKVGVDALVPNPWIKRQLKILLSRLHLLRAAGWLIAQKDLNNRSIDNIFVEVWYLSQRIRFTRRIIQQWAIKLVVLGGDLVHYDTACFIRAAHKERTPAVITPCTMSDELEMAESYAPIKQYWMSRWQNRLFGKYFGQWVFVHKGRALLRLPAERALAMELLRLAPPKPWINLSGFADAIAVESRAMMAYYRRCGISDGQMVVTGTMSDDTLAERLRNASSYRSALLSELGLPRAKPIIVSALPPDQLYMVGGRPECDFHTYQELVGFWIKSLGDQKTHSILISLHPSHKYEDFVHWNNENIRVVRNPIAELIPICDIFIASVSSVIRWAIACGKPVINYDVYRLRYRDYANAPGICATEQRGGFLAELQRLTTEGSHLSKLREAQKKEASQWGMLDGRCGERLLALFDRLTARETSA